MTNVLEPAIFRVPDLPVSVPRYFIAMVAMGVVFFIGAADYSSSEISFGVAYLVPIIASAWWVGMPFALVLSCLSVGLWLYGDFAGNIHFTGMFVPIWNYSFRLLFYFASVYFVVRLQKLQNELGERVKARTIDLTREIAEREQLERELLEISEREQRRIGQDLHDGLCQHLTGTALAGQVLAEKLTARALPEAANSRKIVDLIEEAIALARSLAKGLHPVDMQADGLMTALDDFANTTSDLFKVTCQFECDSPVLIHSAATAGHLYRIAQEAVGNAIKHGQSTIITIHLDAQESGITLRIEDNGIGLPSPLPKKGGIGLQIMAHRSKVIGAKFKTQSGPRGHTTISCFLPTETLPTVVVQ